MEKKQINYKKQGKKNRSSGAEFERRTRADLERKGWIVSKWTNNVNENKCITAKASRFRLSSTGFPDFICYKRVEDINKLWIMLNADNLLFYEIIFVEVKTDGYLDKEEKAKAKWYLDNKYCSKFLIAKKTKVKNKIVVEYKEILK